MDKELLRIVIIATGLVIIIGMLIWGYFRSQRTDETNDSLREIREAMKAKRVALDQNLEIEPEADLGYPKMNAGFDDDDYGYEPHKQSAGFADHASVAAAAGHNQNPQKQPNPADPAKMVVSRDQTLTKHQLPRLIQLSIVAKSDAGFNGADLDTVFNMVGLEYGSSVKIYERLDMERRVDYCVASMVNPGTFPDTDLESFHTPGVTFYMQPQELPDAILVFDDLVRTISLLTNELDGIVWDATRTPLTETTLKALRKSLQVG